MHVTSMHKMMNALHNSLPSTSHSIQSFYKKAKKNNVVISLMTQKLFISCLVNGKSN